MLAFMHIAQDGRPGAPALLLIQNAAAPIALWDPVVPSLAGAYHVIRVDLLGHGRSGSAAVVDAPPARGDLRYLGDERRRGPHRRDPSFAPRCPQALSWVPAKGRAPAGISGR